MSENLTSFIDAFASPAEVFDRIKSKSISVWPPFLLLMVSSTVIMGWYFMTVDLYQFMETSMIISGQETSQQGFEEIMKQEGIIRIVSIAQVAVFGTLVFLILALFYFLAATLIAEEKFSFGQFFSVIAWGSLPSLLSYISIAVTYSLATEFVYLALLDKTSLAAVLGMGLDSEMLSLYSSISIGAIWSFALYGFGFYRLTRCSVPTAVIVGLIPPAIQYGLLVLL